jgi:hypothetical protein
MSKESKLTKPTRDPDFISKRNIEYWWSPEFCRNLNGTICKIRAVDLGNNEVKLQMLSKNGNATDMQGSIVVAFKKWHADRVIDMILFGEDDPWW